MIPGVPFESVPGAEVAYSLGCFEYKATFVTPLSGIQVNLSTRRRRPLRRCQLASDVATQVLPLGAEEIEAVKFTWDSQLSNPDVNLSADRITASSPNILS